MVCKFASPTVLGSFCRYAKKISNENHHQKVKSNQKALCTNNLLGLTVIAFYLVKSITLCWGLYFICHVDGAVFTERNKRDCISKPMIKWHSTGNWIFSAQNVRARISNYLFNWHWFSCRQNIISNLVPVATLKRSRIT